MTRKRDLLADLLVPAVSCLLQMSLGIKLSNTRAETQYQLSRDKSYIGDISM